MPARKAPVKKQAPLERTLRTTVLALVSSRIAFKVHYPTKNSMVITLDGGLTHDQLRVAVDYGANIGPNAQVMILIPKLSNDA